MEFKKYKVDTTIEKKQRQNNQFINKMIFINKMFSILQFSLTPCFNLRINNYSSIFPSVTSKKRDSSKTITVNIRLVVIRTCFKILIPSEASTLKKNKIARRPFSDFANGILIWAATSTQSSSTIIHSRIYIMKYKHKKPVKQHTTKLAYTERLIQPKKLK